MHLPTDKFGRVLAIVAHPDDESIGCSGLLQRAETSLVVFAVDGAPPHYGFAEKFGSLREYSDARFVEASRALACLPHSEHQRLVKADGGYFQDQHLFLELPVAYQRLKQLIREYSPDLMVTHAFEGGHIDHDACHVLAARAARELAIPALEFPLYWQTMFGRDIFQKFRTSGSAELLLKLSPMELERKRQMLAYYATQRNLTEVFQLDSERFRPLILETPPRPGWRSYAFENRRRRLKTRAFLEKAAEFERWISTGENRQIPQAPSRNSAAAASHENNSTVHVVLPQFRARNSGSVDSTTTTLATASQPRFETKKQLNSVFDRFFLPLPKLVGKSCWLSHPLQFTSKTERHILHWVREILGRGDTFFDVGAHTGWVSLVASRRVGPSGRVVAFEPSPSFASMIRYHGRINRVPALVIEPSAVADSCAAADLFSHNQGIGSINFSSKSARTDESSAEAQPPKISVPVRNLDDYCAARHYSPSLIKIDVEGAEFRILQGALRLLASCRPALIVAAHPRPMTDGRPDDLFRLLHDRGYTLRESRAARVGKHVRGDFLFT